MNKNVLTIGGLDPSGCAGILADVKTFIIWRTFGLAVCTTVTAQNTERVELVYPVPLEVIGAQLESIVADIEIHAVKVGLMPNARTVELVAELLRTFRLTNIVVDPVVSASTGYQFADEKTIQAYRDKLFPLAEVVTPNLNEAALFAGKETIKDITAMKEAAEAIHKCGPGNVIVTGGHLEQRAADVLFDGSRHTIFDAPKIASANNRGLGCTFSSILAIHLARKIKLNQAVDPAKKFIARALVHPFKIGHGNGPLNHNVAV
jgi:hydroxymethylpyrimidine/phosphomethylpyrimidine kinase